MDKKEKLALIAGISGEAVIKELKKVNKDVLLICGEENESGADIADDVFIADFSAKKVDILDYLKAKEIKKVILATGHILAFELCKYLEENGCIISVDIKASLLAKDKLAYKKALIDKGFSTPQYIEIGQDSDYNLTEIIKKVGLPCVVKSPIDKIYPQLANDEKELEQAIKEVQELSSVLLEQYIVGIDCTVPVICNYENVQALLVSYYSKAKECHLKGFKEFIQEKLTPAQEEKVKDFVAAALKDTGIIGMARADVIVDKIGKMYILECNSVIVTGVHPHQIEYGIHFLQKENVNFAKFLVDNALTVFKQKENM